MRLPNPIIAEYYVRRTKYYMDENGRAFISWASDTPEVVNTVDIEYLLHQPNTFLVGWLECHYEEVTRAVSGGGVVEQPGERFIRHDHPINQGLIVALSDKARRAFDSDTVVGIPRLRSYERILFDLDWKFRMVPVGETDETWAAFDIPQGIKDKLAEQPEFKMSREFSENPPEDSPLEPSEKSIEEGIALPPQVHAPDSTVPIEIENRLIVVEYGMNHLSDKLNAIIALLEGRTDASNDIHN